MLEYLFRSGGGAFKGLFSGDHEAQFLSLCPLCAAMYKEFVKQDEGAMETFKNERINLHVRC